MSTAATAAPNISPQGEFVRSQAFEPDLADHQHPRRAVLLVLGGKHRGAVPDLRLHPLQGLFQSECGVIPGAARRAPGKERIPITSQRACAIALKERWC